MKAKLSLYALLFVLVVACSKDDDPIDIRKDAEGTYTYVGQMSYVDGSSLISLGSKYDFQGNIQVLLNNDGKTITVLDKSDNSVLCTGNTITQASNGFTFNVPSQTQTIDGKVYILAGYNGITLSGSKYHGMYDKAQKELKLFFSYEDSGITLVAYIRGVKQ